VLEITESADRNWCNSGLCGPLIKRAHSQNSRVRADSREYIADRPGALHAHERALTERLSTVTEHARSREKRGERPCCERPLASPSRPRERNRCAEVGSVSMRGWRRNGNSHYPCFVRAGRPRAVMSVITDGYLDR